MKSRKDKELERILAKRKRGLTSVDRISHSMELSELDMSAKEFNGCTDRFNRTFGKKVK